METSRGRMVPRRLTSRQSQAVEPPQAATPAAVRALFSSSSSVAGPRTCPRRNTLPFATTSQRGASEDPLPIACSEAVSGCRGQSLSCARSIQCCSSSSRLTSTSAYYETASSALELSPACRTRTATSQTSPHTCSIADCASVKPGSRCACRESPRRAAIGDYAGVPEHEPARRNECSRSRSAS